MKLNQAKNCIYEIISLTSTSSLMLFKNDMGPSGDNLKDWRIFGEYMLQKSFNVMSLSGTGPQVRDGDLFIFCD